MQYLTVGTREITSEAFTCVEDTDIRNIKPRGGIWLTRYQGENYNEWIDFIIDDPVIFYYKSRDYSLWEQPCSLVTLKDDAEIFNLCHRNDLEYLLNNYPIDKYKFSYKKMSMTYDGIYIDMYSLLREVKDDELRQRIYKFGVNTLILFNIECIDYYEPGTVSITPFDYEYGACEFPEYKINIKKEKKKVLNKKTAN
jgi:hypothetical protein